MLVSGGVDSTVCAALLHKALRREQVLAVHIDNGFMRKNESALVVKSLETLGLNLKVVNARHTFAEGQTTIPVVSNIGPAIQRAPTKLLCMTANPEEKRKIIGDVFVNVANEIISEMNLRPDDVFLAQGTLRPDLIESASSLASNKADLIKTHHNDTELVRQLRSAGRVIEPLKDFHKDEVRAIGKFIFFSLFYKHIIYMMILILGRSLRLPEELVMRHPFPGPGLAIRVLCADEPFIEKDYSETQVIVKIIVEYQQMLKKVCGSFILRYILTIFYSRQKHALLNRVDSVASEEEKQILKKVSSNRQLSATLLPIRYVT